MKIGIVGYQGSGKSTLFTWLTGTEADPALSHRCQSAMASILDPRVEDLCRVYSPKKITHAMLEMVDTPGLSRDHEGSPAKLAQIREAGCLVQVVAAFGGVDPVADARNFQDDLLLADLDIVQGRVERLRESVKKPIRNREEQQKELEALEPILATLDAGQPLSSLTLTPEQLKATRSFQLFTEKPRMTVVNLEDGDTDVSPERFAALAEWGPVEAVSLRMQLDLARMAPEERDEFCGEMGVALLPSDSLVRRIMDVSGQMLFFTAGEKEVRTWLIRKGGTALEAAAGIHTDLAAGFIRAETMQCDDLVRLGSEREVKAQNLLRREHKDYVIQDGDVLTIQHSN